MKCTLKYYYKAVGKPEANNDMLTFCDIQVQAFKQCLDTLHSRSSLQPERIEFGVSSWCSCCVVHFLRICIASCILKLVRIKFVACLIVKIPWFQLYSVPAQID